MPLFTFKCLNCEEIVEKFFKNECNNLEYECKCGCKEFERIFDFKTSGSVWKNAKDHMENVIEPEINKIQEKLSKGSDSTFLDIVGD